MNAIRNLPGPSLHDYEYEREDAIEEAIDAKARLLMDQYLTDPEKLHAIDVYASELLSSDQCEESFIALVNLAGTDQERLMGSDALARVLRIADDMKAMRLKRLEEVAREDAEDQVMNWSAYA